MGRAVDAPADREGTHLRVRVGAQQLLESRGGQRAKGSSSDHGVRLFITFVMHCTWFPHGTAADQAELSPDSKPSMNTGSIGEVSMIR